MLKKEAKAMEVDDAGDPTEEELFKRSVLVLDCMLA